jgi:release factor glutamine methyltransferase
LFWLRGVEGKMELREALQSGIQRLEAARVGSPRLNAETLLMFVLGSDRAFLFAHSERVLTPDEVLRYDQALGERARGVPAQYVTGHQEFWGLDLLVSPAVLIPRPETEHVVETVLELVEGRSGLKIVDVGTGSGCIALALAKELTDAEIHATEISPEALEIARANAARNQLETRIHFYETDLLAGLEDMVFDFVVSNPPYVAESEADTVEAQVRKFEPRLAVFSGATGLEVYRRLIPQANQVLSPDGWLVLEIGFRSRDQVAKLLEDWRDLRSKNDLQGIPRVMAARK